MRTLSPPQITKSPEPCSGLFSFRGGIEAKPLRTLRGGFEALPIQRAKPGESTVQETNVSEARGRGVEVNREQQAPSLACLGAT